jgi:hypothetical protein
MEDGTEEMKASKHLNASSNQQKKKEKLVNLPIKNYEKDDNANKGIVKNTTKTRRNSKTPMEMK